MTPAQRAQRGVAAVLVAGFAMLVGPAGSYASPAGAASVRTTSTPSRSHTLPSGTVSLGDQPATVALGADVPIALNITGALTQLAVRAVVHGYIGSRTGFERTLKGEQLGSTLGTVAVPAASLPAAGAERVLTIPLQDPNEPRVSPRVRIVLPHGVDAGVYPVEILLTDQATGAQVDGFVTYLVVVASASVAPVGEPLRLAWIWRFARPPASVAPGARDTVLDRMLTPNGDISRITRAVVADTQAAVTLAPEPKLLGDLDQAAANSTVAATARAALRVAAETHDVMTGPYVSVNLPVLTSAGLGSAASQILAHGADTLSDVIGRPVDKKAAFVGPLDASSMGLLGNAGFSQVVVDPSELAPSPSSSQYTPAQPFTLESDGRSWPALQTDPALANLLAGSASVALRAQRFLAAVSVVALELPNARRGVVVATPTDWTPDLPVVTRVLSGIAASPLIKAVSVDGFFDEVPAAEARRGRPTVRTLAAVTPEPSPVDPRTVRATQARVAAFVGLVGADDPLAHHAQDALDVSLSSAWPGAKGRTDARRTLASVNSTIDDLLGHIDAPQGRTITLTARDAAVPISLLNTTGRDLRVKVTLQSDKLLFPHGGSQTVDLVRRNTTTRFDVQIRTSGTFPLKVLVTSEDGSLVIQQTRFTIRSTVVSGVGVILAAGAGVFLALWWLTHWRRSRRGRHPVTAEE